MSFSYLVPLLLYRINNRFGLLSNSQFDMGLLAQIVLTLLLSFTLKSVDGGRTYYCEYMPTVKLYLYADGCGAQTEYSRLRTKRETNPVTPAPITSQDAIVGSASTYSSVSSSLQSQHSRLTSSATQTPASSTAVLDTTTEEEDEETTTTEEEDEGTTVAISPGTTSPSPCEMNVTWGGWFAEKDTPLMYVDKHNKTKVNTREYQIGNVTEETVFLLAHRPYLESLALNSTKQQNLKSVLIQQVYDCCYDISNGGVCHVKQMVNNNVSLSFSFEKDNSKGTTFKDNRLDQEIWVFLNTTIMTTFYPQMSTISARWGRFMEWAHQNNTIHSALGYTKVIQRENGNSTVKCYVYAKDPFDVYMTWMLDRETVPPYNQSAWLNHDDGSGSGWIVVIVETDKLDRLSCFVLSSTQWASVMPVPYPYGPLPLGQDPNATLVAALIVTLIVFAMVAGVGLCVCVCRRRQKSNANLRKVPKTPNIP